MKKVELTSWCGGICINKCKACLIVSGKAELVKVNGSVLTYQVSEAEL